MEGKKSHYSNKKTLLFITTLCFVCALILSILTTLLKKPQSEAKELYKSKQLLRAASILSEENVFILDGIWATYDREKALLIPSPGSKQTAKNRDILSLFESRILTRLTDETGAVLTFEEAGLDLETYLTENEKYGFSNLPYKLVYIVLQNAPLNLLSQDLLPYGYVIPINGYGLWDAIYGYLGLNKNGKTVLGMTWYNQKETPGLGGNIALAQWQQQFQGKTIFQETTEGQTDLYRAPLGIKVVKTTVAETYGKQGLANSAVDGIPGSSITVNGVNEALRNSLEPYRPFLIRAHNRFLQGE